MPTKDQVVLKCHSCGRTRDYDTKLDEPDYPPMCEKCGHPMMIQRIKVRNG